MFKGNGGWGDFNGGAVSDEEVEEGQDVEVIQEQGHHDDLEPVWANGDVEEMWNLFNMNEIQEIIGNKNLLALHQMEDHVNHLGLPQIDHAPGLHQMEDHVNHLGLPQIVHNVDHIVLPQLEPHNGGLEPMLQHIEEQLYLEDDLSLQQINALQQPPPHPHVVHGLTDNLVNLEWLDIVTALGNHEPEPSSGYNGVNVDLGESDEEAHFGEIAELEPEALEDLGPYWVEDDVDNGQEQWNLLNMEPPPDEFFDGVDNDIQGMFGGED